MSLDVEKETFVDADEKTTKALTYDMLNGLHELMNGQFSVCDKRFKILEGRKRRNILIASSSGVFGGVLTSIGYYVKTVVFRQ